MTAINNTPDPEPEKPDVQSHIEIRGTIYMVVPSENGLCHGCHFYESDVTEGGYCPSDDNSCPFACTANGGTILIQQ